MNEPLLIGALLALGVTAGTRLAGLEKEPGFYPTVLIVVASYYSLFAVIGGSVQSLVAETAIFAIFAATAVVGLRINPWWLVVGLAGHGLFDLRHVALIANPGTPAWWPSFCMSYDVTAAVVLGARLAGRARAPQ